MNADSETRSRRPNSAGRADGLRIGAAGPSSMRGYTLIEVIVAFALLALALTLLLGTMSGAARQVRWAGDAGRAALHAQSLIDQIGIVEPLESGQRSGEFEQGRYRWTLGIAPWTDPTAPPAAAQPVALSAPRMVEISLAVEWGDGGRGDRLVLRSLRTAAPDVQGGGGL